MAVIIALIGLQATCLRGMAVFLRNVGVVVCAFYSALAC